MNFKTNMKIWKRVGIGTLSVLALTGTGLGIYNTVELNTSQHQVKTLQTQVKTLQAQQKKQQSNIQDLVTWGNQLDKNISDNASWSTDEFNKIIAAVNNLSK